MWNVHCLQGVGPIESSYEVGVIPPLLDCRLVRPQVAWAGLPDSSSACKEKVMMSLADALLVGIYILGQPRSGRRKYTCYHRSSNNCGRTSH